MLLKINIKYWKYITFYVNFNLYLIYYYFTDFLNYKTKENIISSIDCISNIII